MRRRDFMSLVGGAVAWPTVARGQQQRRTGHIGVFSYSRENDPQAKGYIEAFLKRLAELGWSQGANLRIEYRWTGGNAALIRQYATELGRGRLGCNPRCRRLPRGPATAGYPHAADRLR